MGLGMMMRNFLVPLDQDGYRFILVGIFLTFLGWLLWQPLGWLFLALTLWVGYFFRDPWRQVPQGDHLLVAPADGTVSLIQTVTPPKEWDMGKEDRVRVSIFLNVFDVHIQRLPASGEIEKIYYHPGKFLNAGLDKASDENERQSVIIKMHDGQKIAVVQIAGLIARRIRCDIKEEQKLRKGTRYGLIRFGSRVDVYLPVGVHPTVALGQRAVAGETVLANLETPDPKWHSTKI